MALVVPTIDRRVRISEEITGELAVWIAAQFHPRRMYVSQTPR